MALDQLNPRRAIDGIRDAVTNLIAAADRKWGHGRLRLLVPDDLRERFEVQLAKFETALRSGEILAVRRQAAGVRVGLAALERVARQAGHELLAPEVWTTILDDGSTIAIVRTQVEQLAICDDWPETYTLQDIGRLIAARPELRQIKRNFAGAEIASIQPAPDSDFDWATGDDIEDLGREVA